MRSLTCALAVLVLTAPALAQTAPADQQAARDLIAAAQADGVFEAVSADASQIVVRHERSGLVCRLAPGNTNRLIIFPQSARGEDVACDSHDGRQYVTAFATRYPFETNLDEQAAGAENAIRQRFPDAQPFAASSAPANRTVQFIVTRDGQRTYTSASLAQVGQWVIKLRFSAPAPDDNAARVAEAQASALFTAILAELSTRQA